MKGSYVCIGAMQRETANLPRTIIYMINNHWMRWCLRPSSAYGHGNTYVNEKRVCLFIQQRIRTERSGF